jgi:hypothetical protein
VCARYGLVPPRGGHLPGSCQPGGAGWGGYCLVTLGFPGFDGPVKGSASLRGGVSKRLAIYGSGPGPIGGRRPLHEVQHTAGALRNV